MRSFPKEFELVAACCRWPPSPDQMAAVATAASAVDWPLLLKVAKRHRVQGLVWHALRRTQLVVPEEVAQELSGDAARITRQNLMIVAESVRLKAAFASSDVPLLFIKGVTLATLAYGTLSLKMGWDIDILVPLERLACAADILNRSGYRLVIPKASSEPEQLHQWHSRIKESVWRNDERQTYVELHTELVDNRMLLNGLSPFAAVKQVEVSKGIMLPTLREAELFAYLTVHGASSAWFRLKWLADVAALLSSYDAEQVDRLYLDSQRLGAGRAAAQALLLCDHLFQTRLSPALKAELGSDPANSWLVRLALHAMAGPSFATEMDEIRFGTAGIHLSQFRLLPGWRFKLSEARRQVGALSPVPALLARIWPRQAPRSPARPAGNL